MSAKLVPTIKTVYTQKDMIKGFVEGWQKAFNEIPKKQSIAVLWAQNCIETGATSSMWGNNVGNVKFVPSSNPEDDNGKQYQMLANVWEMINGKKIIFQPPHPATWFRAFPTLREGIAYHLDFLCNHRYKSAWASVQAGDPAGFVHALKMAKYFTALESDYVKGVNAYFKKFMADSTFESVVAAMTQPIPAAQEPSEAPTVTDPVVVPVPVDNGQKLPTSVLGNILNSVFGLFKKI